MKKAFGIFEIMVALATIGLVAASAFPTYRFTKVNRIAKQAYYGQTVSREDQEYLQEHIFLVNDKYLVKRQIEIAQHAAPETPMFIVINGKKYKLVAE